MSVVVVVVVVLVLLLVVVVVVVVVVSAGHVLLATPARSELRSTEQLGLPPSKLQRKRKCGAGNPGSDLHAPLAVQVAVFPPLSWKGPLQEYVTLDPAKVPPLPTVAEYTKEAC